MAEKHIYVLMGGSGCSKSTWARKYVNILDNAIHVSRDSIRFSKLKPGDDYFKYENQVLQEYFACIRTGLYNYDTVICDATHISVKARNELWFNIRQTVEGFKNNGYDVYIYGVWFEYDVEDAVKWNQGRTGLARVADSLVRRMYKTRTYPNVSDKMPFDYIFIYNVYTKELN